MDISVYSKSPGTPSKWWVTTPRQRGTLVISPRPQCGYFKLSSLYSEYPNMLQSHGSCTRGDQSDAVLYIFIKNTWPLKKTPTPLFQTTVGHFSIFPNSTQRELSSCKHNENLSLFQEKTLEIKILEWLNSIIIFFTNSIIYSSTLHEVKKSKEPASNDSSVKMDQNMYRYRHSNISQHFLNL